MHSPIYELKSLEDLKLLLLFNHKHNTLQCIIIIIKKKISTDQITCIYAEDHFKPVRRVS